MSLIHICQVCDINNLKYILVVWKSITINNPDCNFNLHLIHNIVDKNSVDNFKEEFNSIYPDVTLIFYYIDINIPYINRRLKHVTIATMLRLYIPLTLNNIDKVLYLDIDVLVIGNLECIWNLDCGETGLCLKSSIYPSWLQVNNHRCGNAGVMLMNLNTLRQNNFTEKVLDFNLENSEDDQALINKYAQGKYNNLEGNMNIFMNQDHDKYKDPIIYHFVGDKKPWNSLRNNILFQLWHSYNNIVVSTNIRKSGIGIGILIYNTTNLGDWTQTAAALYVWWVYFKRPNTFKNFVETCIEKSEIESYPIIWINRDRISECIKPKEFDKVIILCNGWWMHKYNDKYCFIAPEWITPIYISVHISKSEILSEEVIEYLKKNEPIGCRDNSTKILLQNNGVNAYFSGCLTMTLNLRDTKLGFIPKNNYQNKIVIIDYDMKSRESTIKLTQSITDIHNKYNLIDTVQRSIDLLFAKKIITNRLHVWLPLICNNANIVLMNNNTKKEFVTGDSDYQNINRFNGIIEVINNKNNLKVFNSLLLNRTLYEIIKINYYIDPSIKEKAQRIIDLQDVEIDFEGKKYFVLDSYNLGAAGINHMTVNLTVFFAVARKTGLIIILPYFGLNSKHNFGKEIRTNFLEYYDLSQETFLLSVPDDATPENTYTWRPSNRYNFLNKSDKLIINFKPLHINNYPIHPSIKEKAQIIIDILPKPFISIHVRRGDQILLKPSAYKTTQPVYIFNKILRIMRKNPEVEYKSVYIFSNEENLNYFNSLKRIPIIPKVHTVIDFPELIEQRKTDNYVLYLIEKCIEDAAQSRISTWKTNNPYYSENLDETFGWN